MAKWQIFQISSFNTFGNEAQDVQPKSSITMKIVSTNLKSIAIPQNFTSTYFTPLIIIPYWRDTEYMTVYNTLKFVISRGVTNLKRLIFISSAKHLIH